MPRKVQGAIYADDLVLWCSEEHLSTANYRMQQVLNILEGWTNRWLVKINSRKNTYTIFSISTKEQKATLHINGQTLLAEDNPTYLGWLSTSGWPGNNWPKRLKPEPRCDLPSWSSWQARHGEQILWLSSDCILVESDQYLSTEWQHGALQPSPTLIGSAKYRTRQPASSQGPWSQRR